MAYLHVYFDEIIGEPLSSHPTLFKASAKDEKQGDSLGKERLIAQFLANFSPVWFGRLADVPVGLSGSSTRGKND